MKNKVKYLLKNIILFSLNGFIPKLLAFFIVPIYTSYLTTYDYGIADLINTTASLLVPIFTLDIQDAVIRYVMDKKYKREEVFSVAIKINFIGLLFVLLFTGIVSGLKIFNVPNYFYIFLLVVYAANAFANSINLFCRGIDRVKDILIASIINSVLTIGLNLIFLIVFKWGIIGYLLASSLGLVASIIYLFLGAKLYKYIKKIKNVKLTKEMILYSLPLIFSCLSWWINNASDRYIVTALAGVAVSGLYAMAYKIPSLLTVFQNILTQAWSISAIKEFDKDDKDGFIGNTYTVMNFLMCFGCSGLMVFNVFFAKILFSGDFFVAWKFVPPLLLSVVFNSMALFIGSIVTAVKDTKNLSITTIVGATINTVLNFILITYFGAYGAAIATLIGYLVVLIMRNILLKRYIKMQTNQVINITAYVLLFIQMVLAYWGNKFVVIECIIMLAILFIYRKFLLNIIKTIMSKIKSNKEFAK